MAMVLATKEPASSKGLLVIAALGRNVHRLKSAHQVVESFFDGWSCLALAYTPLPNGTHAEYLTRRCAVELRPGWRWASLLNLTTPAVVEPHEHVMVMLDDIALPDDFSVSNFVAEAYSLNLSKASPTVYGGTWGSSVQPWQSIAFDYADTNHSVASCKRRGGHCSARIVPWIESFLVLYTREAWRCYHSLFDDGALHDSSGAIGFGYDRCFQAHCPAMRQGVLLNYLIRHREGNMNRRHQSAKQKYLSGLKRQGRRLSLASLDRQANAQVVQLERWVQRQYGGPGRPPKCQPRDACFGEGMHHCPIEHSDGTRPSERFYQECWFSCCCYDHSTARAVPAREWRVKRANV